MNKKAAIFVVVLALIGVTASLCIYIKNNRRLGNPGLKMVKESIFDVKGNVIGDETIDLPLRVLDYEASTNLAVTMEELGWLPADTTYGRRIYQDQNNFGIYLSIVMMGVDSRSIHKPEICLPGQGWKIEKSESLAVRVDRPVSYELPVKKIIGSKEVQLPDGRKQKLQVLYVYWFVAENELASEHLDRMWKMGKTLVTTGVLQRWSYVAAMAQCLPGQEDATYERIKEFIAASVPEFQITTGKPLQTETASADAIK